LQAGGSKDRVNAAPVIPDVPATPEAAAPVLPLGAVVCLALQTLAYSVLTLWALELLPVSGSAWLGAMSLPVAYAVAAVLGTAVLAPWLSADGARPVVRAVFVAAYQAIVLIFFLRLAGRLAPQPAAAAWEAGAFMFQTALTLFAVARLWPAVFTGVAFGWIVGLPVFAYMIAELTLVGAGGVSWQDQMRNEHSQGAVLLVRGLLQVSPATALMGALHGTLPDGSAGLFGWVMAGWGGVNGGLMWGMKSKVEGQTSSEVRITKDEVRS